MCRVSYNSISLLHDTTGTDTVKYHNRVRRQSGFPTFIMAQRHYVRMSATRYRCGDNRTKVKTFVTSAWYHWWHDGPYFGLYLTAYLLANGEPCYLPIDSSSMRCQYIQIVLCIFLTSFTRPQNLSTKLLFIPEGRLISPVSALVTSHAVSFHSDGAIHADATSYPLPAATNDITFQPIRCHQQSN